MAFYIPITLQAAFDRNETITIPDGSNKSLTLVNSDTTNNPSTFIITNSGTGLDIAKTSGILKLGGVGATNNESIIFDFEATANVVEIGTGSGVTALSPASADLLALGTATKQFSDLFLTNAGGAIYWGSTTNTRIVSGGTQLTLSDGIFIIAPGDSAGASLSLQTTLATYQDGKGRSLDITDTGNITGTAANTIAEIFIRPAFTLTDPGSGTFTYAGLNSDVSGIAVTAGVGATNLYAGRFIAGTDADAGANRAIYASGSDEFVLAATEQILITATADRTSNTIEAIRLDVDFGADLTLGLHVEGISRGDFNGCVSLSGAMTSGGMTTAGDSSNAVQGQVSDNASDIASTSINAFSATIGTDNSGSGVFNGLNVGTGFDNALFLQSGTITFKDYALSISETNTAGAASGMSITLAAGVTSGAGGGYNLTTGAGTGSGENGGDITFTLGASGGGAGVSGLFNVVGTQTFTSGRFEMAQGADVASATNLSLGFDGNVFELTGTTKVDLISNIGWQEGSVISIVANESVVIDHATATSATNITILLAGAVDYSMTAGDTLTLALCSTTAGGQAWREVARTVI